MQEELLEIIDEKGKVIGLMPRRIVHVTGLRHRGIYLLAFDETRKKVFLQQRAKNKDIAPLKWDFSVSGNLMPGESFESACKREAKEELGIKILGLKKIAMINFSFKYENGKIDNELNALFAGKAIGKIKLQKEEVRAGEWIELKKLLKEMQEKPEKFTPWFLNCKKQLMLLEESLKKQKRKKNKGES